MKLGEVKPKQMILLLVLLLGGLGYAYYSLMLKPAQEAHAVAAGLKEQASKDLRAAQDKLAASQQEQPVAGGTKADADAIGKIQVAKGAIPRNEAIELVMFGLEDLAKKNGVNVIDIKSSAEESTDGAVDPATGEAAATTSKPSTVTIDASATFPGILLYVRAIQERVRSDRGKIYVAGRLMEINELSINDTAGAASVEGTAVGGVTTSIPKGHYMFHLVVQVYAEKNGSETETDEASALGTTTNPSEGAAPQGAADPNAQPGTAAPTEATAPQGQPAESAPAPESTGTTASGAEASTASGGATA